MQILHHNYRRFKTAIGQKRLILELENVENAENAAKKEQKTLQLALNADVLDQQTQKSGAESVDKAFTQLKLAEAIMLGSKKESQTKPGEKPDEIAPDIDKRINELIAQKVEPEAFVTQMKSFIAGLAITKIINIDKKDRKNYDKTVKVGDKNIHVFIEHKGAAMKHGVNEV